MFIDFLCKSEYFILSGLKDVKNEVAHNDMNYHSFIIFENVSFIIGHW
jgi:hypothetical protein